MPYILDGQPLPLDAPFTHLGVRYPANWLRLSTAEDRAELGITWEPDPEPYDERFYWGRDQQGNLIPKDHAELVSLWVSQTRATANSLLSPTDWMIIREADNGAAAPADWKAWREAVRTASGDKVELIEATSDTADLAAYVTGPDYPVWPADPSTPPAPEPEPQ